jgi:polyvinyl alcohol dehydrogenase (cytochrome)
MRKLAVAFIATVLSATGIVSARAADSCAGDAVGGDWRSYGRDLSNTRSQPDEDVIGPGNVTMLAPAWTFSVAGAGGDGGFQSTPAVADGCVFVATETGWVFALNADTGATVWQAHLDGGAFGLTVAGGRVLALVNRVGSPYALALAQSDGHELWRTPPVGEYPGLRTNASTVLWGDTLFFGFSVPEGDANAHAGYAIVDVVNGATLHIGYVIPPEDWALGYGGGGIWTTAVVDNGYAYVGTSNPTSKTLEHEHINAMLKIDIDRTRATFGEIVDAYKGNYDQYFPGLDRQPVCKTIGPYEPLFAVSCVQLDLDFGASGNLFVNSRGDKLFGMLQKSGVYHVLFADTMQQAWTALAGPPSAGGNAGASSVGNGAIYVGGVPGQLSALDPSTGGYLWVTPTPGGGLYQAISNANGVVYALDASGSLDAYDAATGLPLLRRPLTIDALEPAAAASSAGVSIARNTVYAGMAGVLAAYQVS